MPTLSPSPSPTPAGKVYALFIGINAYPDGMELQYCAGDAAGLKGCLAPSPLWSGAEITTLLDSQATKTGIQDALGAIAAKAGPAAHERSLPRGRGFVPFIVIPSLRPGR